MTTGAPIAQCQHCGASLGQTDARFCVICGQALGPQGTAATAAPMSHEPPYDIAGHVSTLARLHLDRAVRRRLRIAMLAVPSALRSSETVLAISDAQWHDRFGLLVITDERALFFDDSVGEVLVDADLESAQTSDLISRDDGLADVVFRWDSEEHFFRAVGGAECASDLVVAAGFETPHTVADDPNTAVPAEVVVPFADDPGAAAICASCGAAYSTVAADGRCPDCGGPLITREGWTSALEPEAVDFQERPIGPVGLVESLERLAKLHRQGLLTADEFAAAKRQLLLGQ